jgi:hypothetical protein
MVIAFLNPQAYTWSFDLFPWAAAIAVPTIAGVLAFERHWQQLRTVESVLLMVLWAWFTITSLVSTNTAWSFLMLELWHRQCADEAARVVA